MGLQDGLVLLLVFYRDNRSGKGDLQTKVGPLWSNIYSLLEFSVIKMGKKFEPDSLETGQFGKWILKFIPIGSFSIEGET